MRILLVEDDHLLGKATAEGLEESFAVDWCQNAEDAQAALETTPYDLVVLDVNLPKKSGLDLLKDLRTKLDQRPVLLLTARDTLRHKVEGLNAGADDYLVKPFDLDELLARCAALIRRSQGRAEPAIIWNDISYEPAAKTLTKTGETIPLSGRELSVLDMLMTHIGKIVDKRQIESHIYDWDSEGVESNTVEVYISSLRRKLGKEFIKTIRGVGYMVPPCR